jgi:phosphopantothenoylcysteine synthetase/decarboxylase
MGYALAAAAADRGWTVDLVSGPVSLAAPRSVNLFRVVSAGEMLEACEARFEACDVFIAVAAVADYRPKEVLARKQKKQSGGVTLDLEPTPDILRTLAARKRPGQIVVGFAAETHDVEAHARQKLIEKNLDWIVANDVGQPGIGMAADDNSVILIGANGSRRAYGPAPKSQVAEFILSNVVPASVPR